MTSKHLLFISRLGATLAVCGVLIFLYSIGRFAVDSPFWDDYDSILGFLCSLITGSQTVGDIVKLFLSLHNEHRIFIPRLITLIDFAIEGKTNFITLIWIGNCGWFAIIFLCWSYAKKIGITIFEFCPALLILTCLSQYELMNWAMASIQQYYQLLFALVCLWMMVVGRVYLTLIFLVLSAFTGGGGLALAPIILVYHFLKKNWSDLLLSVVVVVALIGVYFVLLEYKLPSYHPSLIAALLSPHKLVIFSLGFIGGLAKNLMVSILFGLVLLFFLARRFSCIFEQAPVFFWCIVYLLASALMVSISRSGLGVEVSVSHRYAPYPAVFAAFTYLSLLITAKNMEERAKIWTIGFYLAFLFFLLWDFSGIRNLEKRYNQFQAGEIFYPDPAFGASVIEKSKILGIVK